MFNEPSSETHFIHGVYDFKFLSTFSKRFLQERSVQSMDGKRAEQWWKPGVWPVNHPHIK